MGKKVASTGKNPKSFRLSDEAVSLLAQIAAKERRSETNMVEVLIQEKAAAMNITAPKS